MTAITRYSLAARADLVDIWVYIAKSDEAAADRQIHRIEQAVKRLIDYPEIGHSREEAGAGVRVLTRDRHLIVYRYLAEDKRVVIERIVHGSRNLAALFD